MSGSVFGKIFRTSTWGESHGKGLGVVVDGCPAGIQLCEADIQRDMDRRKPGGNRFATARSEQDQIQIMSGVFEGITTGTPISMLLFNTDQRSGDYSEISKIYRPGHADYTYERKYGIRDYRGGGRSSGRETAGRVAAGAVAKKLLSELGITVTAYTYAIGGITIDRNRFDESEIMNPLAMPDADAYKRAAEMVDEAKASGDSLGGVIECVITGVAPGIGEPVFEKLDAMLGQAVLSVGGIKGVEFGEGFGAAGMMGSEHNDCMYYDGSVLKKHSNHGGGVYGGISDGSDIILRAAVKPTPSIGKTQRTVNNSNENVEINIRGRHDPTIVPRAVVAVEAMAAITVADYVLQGLLSNIKNIKNAYKGMYN